MKRFSLGVMERDGLDDAPVQGEAGA